MKTFQKDLPALLVNLIIILVNLVPIIGLIYYDWGLFLILACYIIELLVAESIILIKVIFLAFCFPEKTISLIKNGFAFAQAFLSIFLLLFIPFMAMFSVFPGNDGWSSFVFLSKSSSQILIFSTLLFIRYLISFFVNFVSKKEYLVFSDLDTNNRNLGELLMGPLRPRLVSTIIVIVLGLFIAAIFKSTIFVGILFVIMKIILELYSHKKEHENTINTKTPHIKNAKQYSIVASIIILITIGLIVTPYFSAFVSIGESKTMEIMPIEYDKSIELTINQLINLNSFDGSRNLLLRVENINYDNMQNCSVRFQLVDGPTGSYWELNTHFYPSDTPISDNTINYFIKDKIYVKNIDCVNKTVSIIIRE